MTRGGGGVKNRDFYGDILFEWPHRGTDCSLMFGELLLSMVCNTERQLLSLRKHNLLKSLEHLQIPFNMNYVAHLGIYQRR